MNIAIIGYGKMGKEIEIVAREKNHQIVAMIDNPNDWELQGKNLTDADVAFEFSIPQNAATNILKCFDVNLPVVCGTTGWLAQYEEVRQVCISEGQSFFYAPNFSIGVNIFFEINKKLARLMRPFSGYEISIEEMHHSMKADSPSGTAIRLADDIVEEIEHKKAWSKAENPDPDQIGITSIREGNIPGIHTVVYESSFDKIEISHSAKSRRGFAMGALMAGEWLIDKKGIFSMKDLLEINDKN